MASSLAAQLSQIAATSTHQLDLKAQRVAHSKSLLFEQRDAVSQSFDTIYQICFEGFQELCALDSRFTRFRRTIFSEQSKTEDRLEMNAEQNKELDIVLDEFLALVGSRLLLQPAIKAVEWLVRRFRYASQSSRIGLLERVLTDHESSEFTSTIPLSSYSHSSHTIQRTCSKYFYRFCPKTSHQLSKF